MSRVVPDQKRKFENDDLFRKLRNESQVKYIGAKDKQPCDKRAILLEDCKKKQLEIAFVGCGITLTLLFKSVVFDKKHNLVSDFVGVDREENVVRMMSPFIFNGVCVMFKGWLDLATLEGKGHLEFDPEAAREEEDLIRQRLQYGRIQPHFPDVTYRPDTPEICLVDSLQFHAPLYRFEPQLGYHHHHHQHHQHHDQQHQHHHHDQQHHHHDVRGSTSGVFSQSMVSEIPFLSPSASPLDRKEHPPPPSSSSSSSSSSAHPQPSHWKKRIRQNSEPSREPHHFQPTSITIPPPPPPLISIRTETETEEQVLDLSKSSKTHPSKSPDSSRGRQTSLDETVSSFYNFSIKQPATSRFGLTPKKKYSNWKVDDVAEVNKDSSTQTSSSDLSIMATRCIHPHQQHPQQPQHPQPQHQQQHQQHQQHHQQHHQPHHQQHPQPHQQHPQPQHPQQQQQHQQSQHQQHQQYERVVQSSTDQVIPGKFQESETKKSQKE